MIGLTFSDRRLLLQSLDMLKSDWHGSESQLLADVTKWARTLKPEFGFERALTQNLAALSRYLIDQHDEQDIASIARGAMLYVLSASQQQPSTVRTFGLLDKAFIASYAVHEIRLRLGKATGFNPPGLRKSEQDQAERLFLEFVDRPLLGDDELVSKARSEGQKLAGLAACGLFGRMRNNIEYLISALRDSKHCSEHHSYARAALSYVVCEQDAIDDRLGIVGYLDDNFIVQMAVDLIEPAREPWLELLDAAVSAWPFLNGISIDDGSGARPISEYMIINSALMCPQVRRGERGLTRLVVPEAGPVPFLLGFMATLGLVQDSDQRGVTEDSFRVGQKVLVDHCSVAEFAGYDTCNGRRLFKLRQYHKQQGHLLPCDHLWPITDLCRLIPIDAGRVPRGQLVHDLSRTDALLPALEYLFDTRKSSHLASVKQRTILAMPLASAHEFATKLTLYGQRLKEVLPMGHLTETGVAAWSNRFGQQEPLLIVASDLDAACRFAEERLVDIGTIVVDLQGRNASKSASLHRLQHIGVSTLVVSPERMAVELPDEDGKAAIWEWSNDDFQSLLWPAATETSPDRRGPILTHERRLQTRSSSRIDAIIVPCEIANTAFESVRSIRALAVKRRDEPLVELDDIVSLAFSLVFRLLRCAIPLSTGDVITQGATRDLGRIANILRHTNYLTAEERKAIEHFQQLLPGFVDALTIDNPKARMVRQLLAEFPDLWLFCPDQQLIAELQAVYGRSGTRILAGYNSDSDIIHRATIPGWFGKERMAALLIPSVASHMHLVMYGVEERWYVGFCREIQRTRSIRFASSVRQRVFPGLSGWRQPKETKPAGVDGQVDSSLKDLDAIQEYVRKGYRQRVYNSARSDGTEEEVPARLIVFDGGACAFLTESREANVVTHLLDNSIDDMETSPDVRRKSTPELKVGDALLFNLGSDRDVIRMAADNMLRPGVRDTSALWRRVLIEYTSREGISSEQLHARLRTGGCPLQHQAIKNWIENDQIIAPQAYKRDVAVVANVTGDRTLTTKLDSVLSAISDVRSAHLRASHQLARQVLARAVSILKEDDQADSMIRLAEEVVVVRIAEIDDQQVSVRASICNRLLEGDAWRE